MSRDYTRIMLFWSHASLRPLMEKGDSLLFARPRCVAASRDSVPIPHSSLNPSVPENRVCRSSSREFTLLPSRHRLEAASNVTKRCKWQLPLQLVEGASFEAVQSFRGARKSLELLHLIGRSRALSWLLDARQMVLTGESQRRNSTFRSSAKRKG